MNTRSFAETTEGSLAIVRGVIDDSDPKKSNLRIIIITKHHSIRYSLETQMPYSGRNLDLARMEWFWRTDYNENTLAEWIKFGSPFDDVYQLAVTKPGQVYICRSSAPDEPISPARPDILPLLTAVLGRISNAERSDWTYELYNRFSGLLAEILEDVRRSIQKGESRARRNTPINGVRIDLTDDEIAQIDTAGLARMLGMDEEQIKRSVRNKGSVGEETREDILRATTIDELFRLSLNVAPCTADEDACFRAIGWVAFRKPQV